MSETEIKDSIHKLNLNNKNSVIIDDTGKSIACFAIKDNVAIDNKIIKQLKNLSQELGKKDIRICLHNNRDSNLHNMINLIYRREENIPHKHIDKSESYHIIEGRMIITIFDDKGTIKDECLLDEDDTFLFRIGENTFHTTVPKTEYVIFHEVRPGPFPKDGDSILIKQYESF